MRSSSTPPKTIAPMRPLPSGSDWWKLVAGLSNQRVVVDSAAQAACSSASGAVITAMVKAARACPIVLFISEVLFRTQIDNAVHIPVRPATLSLIVVTQNSVSQYVRFSRRHHRQVGLSGFPQSPAPTFPRQGWPRRLGPRP